MQRTSIHNPVKWLRYILCTLALSILPFGVVRAQFNTERVMIMGRSALYYEDYVLSIQRFSLVINARPHLAEPYFYRGLAKFYLEDFLGAEADVSNAIQRNPYTPNYYVLRGLCRVNAGKYAEAESDYVKSIELNPTDADSWHNMVLCQIEQKEFQRADSCLGVMIGKWPQTSSHYSIRAQVALSLQDTLGAEQWTDRALEVNAFDGNAWSLKGNLLLNRNEYAEGEAALDKAILQLPRQSDLYVNRAMARYYQDNLRGAMSDYDAALELNNQNFLGHFNRALLRAQVGDDNRAIEDFNFVIEHEPDNFVAIYNRSILLDNTGDYKAAIRDLDCILKEYPEFWDGYLMRAAVRRKLGDVYGAERDEFKVLKARMDGTSGTRKKSAKKTRKESDQNLEDYNKLVVADEEEYHEQYANEYRGKVQNRDTEVRLENPYVLSYYTRQSLGRETVIFLPVIEALNTSRILPSTIYLTADEGPIGSDDADRYFEDIAQQSRLIDEAFNTSSISVPALLRRAFSYYHVRDFESGLLDLDALLESSPQHVVALFLRAQMRMALNFNEDELKKETKLEYNKVIDDLKQVLKLDKDFIYALYNMGNVYYTLHEYDKAVDAYNEVLSVDPRFAEAYYNRGLSHIMNGKLEQGLSDLSQAGEYGLYSAYNLIKKYSKK